jgi:HlyD family secretion protein
MTVSRRKLFYIVAAAVLALLVVFAFLPDPVTVETAAVTRGPMQVTVEDQGKTRVVDRFTVTAPTAGRLERIDLREGAPVAAGDVIARIAPLPLEPVRREELQSLLGAATASEREAAAAEARAEAAWELARSERRRVEGLASSGVVSQSDVDAARTREETARRDVTAARAAVSAAASNAAAARARLTGSQAPQPGTTLLVRSPAAGRVLRIPDRSTRVVQAGAPLLEVGNANRLELVVEVLSEEAVKVRPGNEVIVEEWGGDTPLRGIVRVVEPSAFTKFSALGIEEQRVNVVADVPDPPPALGDAYRIEAAIVIWSDANALRVPVSALGRSGDAWSVFVVEGTRARRRTITIGQRNSREAQVLSGLNQGDRVVVHPATEVVDGVKVREER